MKNKLGGEDLSDEVQKEIGDCFIENFKTIIGFMLAVGVAATIANYFNVGGG